MAETTYVYKRVGELDIRADVHRLPGDEIRPVLVWIHGGALITGQRTGLRAEQRQRYLDAGYVVVSIDYRLAPETKLPGIITDLRDAFAWVREKGPELFRIDPRRVGVVGHSAGGYLTLMSGFAVRPRPRALVAFYGYGDVVGDWYAKPDPYYRTTQPLFPREEALQAIGSREISEGNVPNRGKFYLYCRQNGLWPREVVGLDPEKQPRAFDPYCPIRNVAREYPPTLLLHGDIDTDVPYQQSVDMARELQRADVTHELLSFRGYGHGFDGKGLQDPRIADAFDRIIRFLKERV
jgi:acetyl esterase/lipase